MNLKFLILITITTVALLLFNNRDQIGITPQTLVEKPVADDEAFSFMSGVTIISTNQDGKPIRSVKTSSLRHYRGTNSTRMHEPEVEILEKERPQWTLNAAVGEIVDDNLVTLSSGVTIESHAVDGDTFTATTQRIHYNMNQQRLYTSLPVRLKQNRVEMSATGMVADLSQKYIELQSDVRGVYEPAK